MMMRSSTAKQICLRGSRKYVSQPESKISGSRSDLTKKTLKVQQFSCGSVGRQQKSIAIIVDRHCVLKLKQQEQRHLVARAKSSTNTLPSKKKFVYNSLRTKSTTTSSSSSPARRQQSTALSMGTSQAANKASSSTTTMSSSSTTFYERLGVMLVKPRTLPIPRWISPRHYEFQLSEFFGHSSFILVAISYAVDDFFQLRVLAVAGSTAMLFFTYFHPHGRVLWLPFKWNVLFIALNSYRIGKVLLAEWRGEQLSDDLKRLRQDHFSAVDLKDFANLVKLAKMETYEDGEYVIHQGEPNRYIRLVCSGLLECERDGQLTYHLEEGNFVSEAGLHSGLMLTGNVDSCCGIYARGKQVKVLAWDRTELMETLQRDKNMRISMKAALSWDIVRKLKAQRLLLVNHEVDDADLWTLKRTEQNDARYDSILHNILSHRDVQWKDELNKYRLIHQVDDEHHRIALKRFGWTPKEFDAGFREGDDDDDEYFEKEAVMKHDWKWWIKDLCLRVIG